MWIVWSVAAAIIWGINYAVSGRLLSRGLSAWTLFLLDAIVGVFVVGGLVLAFGRGKEMLAELQNLHGEYHWLAIAALASTSAGVFIFLAIGGKNATVASLIEISYPFFVALFAWLLFREAELNLATLIGGVLILLGVAIVFYANNAPGH
jgi:drug/metabolite transporter (DMT)-like permease